jgi:hypothetical protein
MSPWKCAVGGCGETFADPEAAIVHQTTDHERVECEVCGAVVPEGYFAIRHAFDEHTRAEYVRAYDADSAAVRERERVKAEIEDEADIGRVVEQLQEVGVL